MEKRVIYTRPEIGQEEFVRHIFSIYAKELGFEIINIQKRFPDCTAIDTRSGVNSLVQIELEYHAGNFTQHGHMEQMNDAETCIVVCWTNKGIHLIPEDIEVIVLSEQQYNFEIRDAYLDYSLSNSTSTAPLYRVINYVSAVAGNKSFSDFQRTSIFRSNVKFSGNKLPKGSVIVLKEQNRLLGEVTVIGYKWYENPPQTKYEKELYDLTTYPVTISEEYTENFYAREWIKGHIIYTDFKIYDPSVDATILGRSKYERNFYITFEELKRIRGLS